MTADAAETKVDSERREMLIIQLTCVVLLYHVLDAIKTNVFIPSQRYDSMLIFLTRLDGGKSAKATLKEA